MTVQQPVAPASVVGDRYRTEDVPVRGGMLRVAVWEPEGGPPAGQVPTVVAVHGITSSHLAWGLLPQALPDVRVIAPDLRGRGRSNGLPGPYGMAQHADDVAAVMTALGVSRAVVAGHSMGGFVAVVLAHRHPGLVDSLVLVDGGLPLVPPEQMATEDFADALLGPAAHRLAMHFPDRPAYQEFFRTHPAFAGQWSDLLAAYVDYDLVGEEPTLRPATSIDALRHDIADQVESETLWDALAGLQHDTAWLLAPRGLQDEVPPLYPRADRERWLADYPQLRATEVPDVNHYTIVLGEAGMAVVAPVLREALGG